MTEAARGEKVGSVYYEVDLDLAKMIRGQREADKALKSTSGSLDQFGAKLSAITKAVSAYAAALWLVGQSDAYTKLNAQLTLATSGTRELATAQADVKRIAQEAQTSISGVGVLYARVATAAKEMGTSQAEVAAIVRTVALSLKVSGASAQESASATLQLSQAFASGVLRGEEFNAVNEAAPRLMKALADGIGVPTGALRGMAEQGLLTSDVLAKALPKALSDLEKEAKHVQTVSGAYQQLQNEVLLFIGAQTSSSGAAKLTASAVSTLAANIDTLAAAAYGFAAAKLGSLLLEASRSAAMSAKALLDNAVAQQASRAAAVASAAAEVEKVKAQIATLAATKQAIVTAREQVTAELQLMNAFRARGLAMTQVGAATTQLAVLGRQQASVSAQQAAATVALAAAQTGLATATRAASIAGRFASSALGLLGGPIGAITTLLGLGVTAWALWGDSAKEGEQAATAEVERSTQEIIEDLDKQIEKLKERNSLAAAGLGGIAKQETDAARRLAALQGQIDNLMAGKSPDGSGALPEAARVDLLQKLLAQYGQLAGRIQEVNAQQEKLQATGASSKLSEWMLKYATDAERARIEIEKAKKELGSAFTPELERRITDKYIKTKKEPKELFDQAAYLSSLRQAHADEIEAVRIKEEELQRINDQRRAKGQIDEKAYGEAAELIAVTAAEDIADARSRIHKRELDERNRADAEAARDERRRQQGVDFAREVIAGDDPVAQVRVQEERRLAVISEFQSRDLENSALYENAKIALRQQSADRIAEIESRAAESALASTSNAFGQLTGVLRDSVGEQDGIYKAMFTAQKAFAIASAAVNIHKGISDAAAQGKTWQEKLVAIASITSATASILSNIRSVNYGGGRQYGGPVSAGSMYRVNEDGRPEMFTASNGSQYLLPTRSGQVTPAGDVGASRAGWTVIINNNAPQAHGSVTNIDEQQKTIEIAVQRAVSTVADSFASNNGQPWTSLRGASNVQGRL